MDTRGWTPGYAAFTAAYPACRRDHSIARWWLNEGFEGEFEEIMAGLAKWVAYWARIADESKIPGMRKFLERKDYKGDPPRAAAAESPGQRKETNWGVQSPRKGAAV